EHQAIAARKSRSRRSAPSPRRWWDRAIVLHGSCAWRRRGGSCRLSFAQSQMIDEVDAGDEADELVAFADDGDFVALEDRRQLFQRIADLHGFQPRGHGAAHRVLELLRAELIVAFDMREDVVLV